MNDYSKLLPTMLFGEELMQRIQVLPEYNDSFSKLDAGTRMMKLMDIYKVFIPNTMASEIYHKLYMMTAMSLQQKGNAKAIRQLNANHQWMSGSEYHGVITGASSCTVIGPSGCGKTSAVQRAVEMLGGTLVVDSPHQMIIPALIVSTPFDCNYRGLLLQILISVDNELGTDYYKTASKSNMNAQQILGLVCQVAHLYIGTLVLDEIQFLVQHRAGTTLYKMILQLINASGISVMMVGTEECLDYFDQAPQMARRTTGLRYYNLAFGEEFYKLSLNLFSMQYVKEKCEFTESICVWLYEHTAGNIANLMSLIHDAQEISIMDGREVLDIVALTKAYNQRMKMLHMYIEPEMNKRKSTSDKPKEEITLITKSVNTPCSDFAISSIAKKIKMQGFDAISEYQKHFTVEEVCV